MKPIRTVALASALLLSLAASAAAQQTIFLVRHAERADGGAAGAPGMVSPANDPPLSAAGKARAARLASMLRSAGIAHVFTTEYKRTRETAAPLAAQLKLTQVMAAAKDLDPLVERVRQVKGNVLIVGHTNTVPDLLKRFGLKDTVAMADDEYDNLFIVFRPAAGEPTLIRVRY